MKSLDNKLSASVDGLTKAELLLLINEAAEHGAKKALREVGLQDENAIHDIKELRNLLDSWRDTRRSIASTVIKIITVAVLGFIAVAVWTEFKGKL
jgi:hypothetical protein